VPSKPGPLVGPGFFTPAENGKFEMSKDKTSTAAGTRGFTTTILHSDAQAGIEHGALHKPLHLSVAYGYEDARDLAAVFQGTAQGYVYGRQGNPTSGALEAKVSKMEGGIGTVCFATGMGAIGAIMLALLREGDHVVASQFLFGNTVSLFGTLAAHGIGVSFVDPTDAANVEHALTPRTRLVFVETIANPRTQVADLGRIGDLCKSRGVLYVVDNTMTSPALFKPAAVHAGLVVNSLTKYIGGHGNALGGAITDTGQYDWSGFPNILDTYRKKEPAGWGILQLRKKGLRDYGATLVAEAAHRIAIGAETLALRMHKACANALELARALETHPRIARVYYPGLPSHDQHARSCELFRAHGALMAIELEAGADHLAFMNRLRYVVSSTHLGDTRTLAIPVATTIYHEMGPARRAEMGIADTLIRLSIGIEDSDDLLADFAQALEPAAA